MLKFMFNMSSSFLDDSWETTESYAVKGTIVFLCLVFAICDVLILPLKLLAYGVGFLASKVMDKYGT